MTTHAKPRIACFDEIRDVALLPSRQVSVSREALHDEVWAEPMTVVAARYTVSSSFLARVCQSLGVPRPPRGYWAQLKVGKPVTRPAFPVPRRSAFVTLDRDPHVTRWWPASRNRSSICGPCPRAATSDHAIFVVCNDSEWYCSVVHHGRFSTHTGLDDL